MKRQSEVSKLLAALLIMATQSGCSIVNAVFPDHSQDYKKAKTAARLEVPPELKTTTLSDSLPVADDTASLVDYSRKQQRASQPGASNQVMPEQKGVHLERDRDRYWLVVDGDPQTVWSRAREFWLAKGFLIVREDPATGILETDWVENGSNTPQGLVQGVIGRVFDKMHSSALRDKFRMRLERGEKQGTTEIYITHQGIEENMQGADDIQTAVWEPRPSDPGLEVEKLKQLLVFLGVEPERVEALAGAAKPKPERASLLKDGPDHTTLVLHEDFSRAWRSIGIALDRVGFAVEDRNRSDGIYYVRYRDLVKAENRKGLFSRLAFWSKNDSSENDQYQISLTADGPETRVTVLDADGKPEMSPTAVRILNLLYEKLR